MGRACDIHSGLMIAAGLCLRTREQADGTWLAWIERDGQPLSYAPDVPRSFSGATCYQAQCGAARWLRDQGLGSNPACCQDCGQ